MAASIIGLGGIGTITTTSSGTATLVVYNRHMPGLSTIDGGSFNFFRLNNPGLLVTGATTSDYIHVRAYTTGGNTSAGVSGLKILCNDLTLKPGDDITISGGFDKNEIELILAWGSLAVPNQSGNAAAAMVLIASPQGAR